MRFASAWAEVISQNNVLRVAIIALSVAVMLLSVVAGKVALRAPLVIERGCTSGVAKASDVADVSPNSVELHAFVTSALPMRFDSTARVEAAWIDPAQLKSRDIEQEDLKKKKLSQRIAIESVSVAGNKITVRADRIIAIGKVRSAFPVILDVRIERTRRSAMNPYGLVFTGFDANDANDANDAKEVPTAKEVNHD